jgi:hypothetical protein
VIPVPIRQTRWFVGRSSYRTLGARGHGRPYAIAVGGEGGCALIERFERAGVKAGKDVLTRRRKSDYSEIEIREVRPRSPHSLPEYSASAAGGHEQISSYELPRLASAAWLTGTPQAPSLFRPCIFRQPYRFCIAPMMEWSDRTESKAPSALKANSTSRAVPNAVPAIFET